MARSVLALITASVLGGTACASTGRLPTVEAAAEDAPSSHRARRDERSTSASEAPAGSPEGQENPARWGVTLAARTRPVGGFVGVDALFPVGDGFEAGAYLDYFYYWADLGAKVRYTLLDGFLVAEGWLGVEPGEFVSADVADPQGPLSDLPRQAGLRGVARGRLTLNLRNDLFWLYNRLTVAGRVRSFAELDPFRAARLDTELSVEEAFAPMLRVASWGEESRLWMYGELTVEAEAHFGLLDLRPSAGLIAEEILDGVTVNLDIYRSFREGTRLEGFGALVFVWWSP